MISAIRNFLSSRRAGVATEFAMIFPIMLVLSLGLLEITILLYQLHRASESTRYAARAFLITPAITQFDGLPVTCPGGAGCSDAVVNNVVNNLQALLPGLTSANIRVTYADSELPVNADAGLLVVPLVTVRITGVQHTFPILGAIVPGVPTSITLPEFSTSQLGSAQPT